MPTFAYSGRTRRGQPVSGQRIADTIDAAVGALRREQVFVTKIDAVKGRSARKQRRGQAVPTKNLAIFTRQFSVMIDAGLPLVQCLEILGQQEEDKNFSQVILQTRTDVEGGSGLADAMRKHSGAFDPLYTNMMAAGEAGGILDTILKRLAAYVEKNVKLKAQVRSAMTYPIAVLTIAAIVVGAILWKVIPTFADLFAGLGATLPLPTLIVIALSDALVSFMPIVILAGVALTFGFRQFYATEQGRRVVDGALLKMPVLGADFAQGGRRPFLPDPGDVARLRGADSRRSRDHRQDRRQRSHRGCRHGDPGGDRTG